MQALSTLVPGYQIDRFRIVRLLGRGGMGEVYLARDTRLGRKVAIKVIHPDKVGTQSALEQFLFEARATATFSHPHIITIYEVGEFEGLSYVALEYLSGQTLRERMQEDKVSLDESIRICLAIGEALEEAHLHQVLHRDLKPDNVFIPKDGRVRVLDFGLAKVLETQSIRSEHLRFHPDGPDEEALEHLSAAEAMETTMVPAFESEEGVICGTPAYMAPEQWSGDSCGGFTDVWALGVLFFELLLGKRPYRHLEDSVFSLAHAVCRPEPVPGIEKLKVFPEEMTLLVTSALQKNPEDRPSAGEVVERLKQALSRKYDFLTEKKSPFRGLLAFSERHAPFFFGRDEESAAFLERLREVPVLPVVGPSGAGKSSFVKAGIIPRLREQGTWSVLSMRPGQDPFQTLASRLLSRDSLRSTPSITDATERSVESMKIEEQKRLLNEENQLAKDLLEKPALLSLMLNRLSDEKQSKIILFVDQLEELYTLVEDRLVRERFMEALCSAADDHQDPVRVVFTLRDDFLGQMVGGASVREALQRITVLWSPKENALEDILHKPLERVGYRYESPALPKAMIAAVKGEKGGLPLLQFTLEMLWEARDQEERLLRHSAYEQMGGLAGALAKHADSVFEKMLPSQIRLSREILLRLITAKGTRKTLSRDLLLEGLESQAEHVLLELTQTRLISVRRGRTGSAGVSELELAHESLIHSWERLVRWLDESREELVFLAEVEQAATLWNKRGFRESEVWVGDALHEAQRILSRCTMQIPQQTRDFLKAGQDKEDRLAKGKKLQMFAGAFFLIMIAAISVLFAINFSRQKEEEKRLKIQAQKERKESEKRHAAAQREGARSAFVRGSFLEARARLRSSLEIQDSPLSRILWWQINSTATLWKKDMGAIMYGVAFSPDGQTVAVASLDRSVYLIDVRTRAVRILHGYADQVLCVSYSPNGRYLAASSWVGPIVIRDLQTGKKRILSNETYSSQRLQFSHDSKFLASDALQNIRIWDVKSGKLLRTLKGHKSVVRSLVFSRNGKNLRSGSKNGTLRTWDLRTGKTIESFPLSGLEMAFDEKGRMHVTVDAKNLYIHNGNTGLKKTVRRQRAGRIRAVQVRSDKNFFALGHADGSIHIRDLRTGAVKTSLLGHTNYVVGLALSPDGKKLVSISKDRTVRLWDLTLERSKKSILPHFREIQSIAFSPNSRMLASGGQDGAIRLWNLTNGQSERALSGHKKSVDTLIFSPDNHTLISGDSSGLIRFWHVHSGRDKGHKIQWLQLDGGVFRFYITEDKKSLISLADGGASRIWDLKKRTLKYTLPAQTRSFGSGFRKKRLALGLLGGPMQLWDSSNGLLLKQLPAHKGGVYSAAVSPDGTMFATGGKDTLIRLWTTDKNPSYKTFTGHKLRVFALLFTADNRFLLSAGFDTSIRKWDVKDGSVELIGKHKKRVYRLAMHPGKKHFASASADMTARIWSLKDNSYIPLRGHKADVNELQFSPDGKWLVTCSDDATIRLWHALSGKPVWRAPLLLRYPVQVYTHQGWQILDSKRKQAPTSQPTKRSKRAWQKMIEESARLAVESELGDFLCVRTHNDALELWEVKKDRRILKTKIDGLDKIVAVPSGCLALAKKTAWLVLKNKQKLRIMGDATAIAWQQNRILVAAKESLFLFDGLGKRIRSYRIAQNVTAIKMLPKRMLLGFGNGSVDVFSLDTSSEGYRRERTFEDVPSSPVERIIAGPMGTVAVGFANGVFGIWDKENGVQLYQRRLHGPIIHLLFHEHKLYAATDIGDVMTLELSIFGKKHCELLREVWQKVPLVWENGLPVLRTITKSSKCR